MALVFVLVAIAAGIALFVDAKGTVSVIAQTLLVLGLCLIAAWVYLLEKRLM